MFNISIMVQVLGRKSSVKNANDYHIYNAAGKCAGTKYKNETCLMPAQGKYPVTENGSLSKARVQAALVYGSKMGVLGTLKANGLCGYVKKVGIENSSVCK